MPTVFTMSPVGSVVRLPDSSRTMTIGFIGVEGLTPIGVFTTQRSIITSWSMDENVNVQFTHTMGNDIYLNVFGNRMGVATINGISFNSVGDMQAEEASVGGCSNESHGINRIIEWYRMNRVSNPFSKRIVINISDGGDGGVIDGFLIGASYRSNDPVNWTAEYTMNIATVPR